MSRARTRRSLVKPAWSPPRNDGSEDPLTYVEWLSIATYHPDQNEAWLQHERYGREHENHRRAYAESFDMGGEA